MKREIELLAPGGDINSIKAAIVAGADAVYFGLNKFNARNRATNIDFENLNGIINLAHENNCKVFLTLNIIILESEFPYLINLLNRIVNTNIDGVIVQDFGLFYLLSKYFKGLEIHASTQLTTHNEGQIKFLSKLNATRVNLSRELNINEIKALTSIGHENDILTEVFVHGSYCIGFSGLCYLSSVHSGNSGNRGRCSQPCRDRYLTTPEGKIFPLNLKDNSAYLDLEELADAGVDSIKIEGRIKSFDYVYTIVNCFKKQLQNFYERGRLSNDNSDLYKVFNRGFSNSYLKGDINKNMFIDNPRDNSIKRFSGINDDSINKKLVKEKTEYYDGKAEIIKIVKTKIKQLSIAKTPLTISISGEIDSPLKVTVKTSNTSFIVLSETNLVHAGRYNLNSDILLATFKALNNTKYYIKKMELENLPKDLFIPFKDIALIKKRIFFILNDSKEIVDQINVPVIKKQSTLKVKPEVSVLISSQKDLHLCNKTFSDIYFQLPNDFKNKSTDLLNLFLKYSQYR